MSVEGRRESHFPLGTRLLAGCPYPTSTKGGHEVRGKEMSWGGFWAKLKGVAVSWM